MSKNQTKKQRKKERQAANRAAAIAAANQKKTVTPAAPTVPVEQKTKAVKCYEIQFSMISANEKLIPSGQYFHQPKGTFQGVMDSFAYIHRYVEVEREKSGDLLAIEKVAIYEWSLAIPGPRGIINSKKYKDPIFSWSHTGKIKCIATSLNKKQQRRCQAAAVYLDKWRPMKVKVVIEEITQDSDNEVGVPLGLAS